MPVSALLARSPVARRVTLWWDWRDPSPPPPPPAIASVAFASRRGSRLLQVRSMSIAVGCAPPSTRRAIGSCLRASSQPRGDVERGAVVFVERLA